MGLGFWEAGLLLAIVVVLFGAGKLPSVMGDLAKGLKRFKADMAEDAPPAAKEPEAPPAAPSLLTHQAATPPQSQPEARPADRA